MCYDVRKMFERKSIFSKNGKWKKLSVQLLTPRRYCVAVAVGKYIFVIGGNDDKENGLLTVEVLDTERETIQMGPSMNFTRYCFTACVVDDTIWVVGGSGNDRKGVESLRVDLSNEFVKESWQRIEEKTKEERWGHSMVAIGSYLIVMGGDDTDSCEMFDTRNEIWSMLPNKLNKKRFKAAAVALRDKTVLCIGGSGYKSVESLEFELDRQTIDG